MQLMLVRSAVGLSLELLRVVPCALAAVRRAAGPGLTQKERDAPWLGLGPLSEPGVLAQAAVASDAVLMLVILLTYAVLSPITCFVMAGCFGVAAVVYRNQASSCARRDASTQAEKCTLCDGDAPMRPSRRALIVRTLLT